MNLKGVIILALLASACGMSDMKDNTSQMAGTTTHMDTTTTNMNGTIAHLDSTITHMDGQMTKLAQILSNLSVQTSHLEDQMDKLTTMTQNVDDNTDQLNDVNRQVLGKLAGLYNLSADQALYLLNTREISFTELALAKLAGVNTEAKNGEQPDVDMLESIAPALKNPINIVERNPLALKSAIGLLTEAVQIKGALTKLKGQSEFPASFAEALKNASVTVDADQSQRTFSDEELQVKQAFAEKINGLLSQLSGSNS